MAQRTEMHETMAPPIILSKDEEKDLDSESTATTRIRLVSLGVPLLGQSVIPQLVVPGPVYTKKHAISTSWRGLEKASGVDP